MKSTRPASFRPMTPAVTEDSTLSNSRRRVSVASFCSISASRWPFNCRVIWLKQAAQHRDLVIAAFFGDTHVEVALSNALRRSRQLPPTGREQALGEPQAQPDRRQHHDQREAEVEKPETRTERGAIGLQLPVRAARSACVSSSSARMSPSTSRLTVEVTVGKGRQPQEGAKTRFCSRSSISTSSPSRRADEVVIARAFVVRTGSSPSPRARILARRPVR